MFVRHTTKDGRTIRICQMDDTHLRNTIIMYLDKIKKAKETIDGDFSKIDRFNANLLGINQEKLQKKADDFIRKMTNKLYAYIAEASLRGFDFKKELQEAFGRSGALPSVEIQDELLGLEKHIEVFVLNDLKKDVFE